MLLSCNNSNVAVETTIGQKSTINFDVLASFWKSINGNRGSFTPLPEYRYHFKAIDRGFYAGGHWGYYISFSKWNYLNTDLYGTWILYWCNYWIQSKK
jgi:hypothetical protein